MDEEIKLINYNIIGEFNSGLKVYLENKLIMYSEEDRKFFSDVIRIYNKASCLILKVKQHSDCYEIKKMNDEDFLDIEQINRDEIIFKENKRIEFKSKRLTISSYPKMKIYFENKEIGLIETKQFSLSINTNLYLEKCGSELIQYILILLLCRFSSVDHG